MLGMVSENVDAATRNKLLRRLGRYCARENSGLTTKHKNDLSGFLQSIQEWGAKPGYDEAAGTIRVVEARPCSCPLVKEGVTPPEFCECTLGWQEEAYSTVLGKPVQVFLDESRLRGSDRCVFRIQIS
jgi:predicted hydrocarbon binding protein